jgi:hypothetical protein
MVSPARVAESNNDDPALSAEAESEPCAGSFERDTLTWAFAKLAECVLDALFSNAESLGRYSRWLYEDAPQLVAGAGPEQGLLLEELELGSDGHLSLIARPRSGEFIVDVRHARFSLVLGSAYAVLTRRPEQEAVCVVHFEGDAELAARWATGLRHSLTRSHAECCVKPSSLQN